MLFSKCLAGRADFCYFVQEPTPLAVILLDRRDLVRAMAFSPTANLLALGTVRGDILIYSLEGCTQPTLVARGDQAHSAAVNQLAFRSAGGSGWDLESVSKDGTRAVHQVEQSPTGDWGLVAVSSDRLSRGDVSQILPPAVPGGPPRYLALVESTALVVDASGSTVSGVDQARRRAAMLTQALS